MNRPDISFIPAPANDFSEYIDLYWKECRNSYRKIAAIAGKWTFEDLIPGLSDFDTRFIVDDGMEPEDWCRMSEAVGTVHLDLCCRYPHWARNLEHLPGINLTWQELTGTATYYPEYVQWSYYHTASPQRLDEARQSLAARTWSVEDEYFHLKKFCLYYGRYERGIDPPINIGPCEGKYPLHSRFMHYFCPPLQSALCLLLRRPIAGKTESVRLACEMFPEVAVLEEMARAVEAHYERPRLYEEPALSGLEDRLESALDFLRRRLAPQLTLVPNAAAKSMTEWKMELSKAPVDPAMVIFDAAKFARLMKGRLSFYGRAPDYFDAEWLIENEMNRMHRNFMQIPFGLYWKMRTGEEAADVMTALPRLAEDLFTDAEREGVIEFDRLFSVTRTPANRRAVVLDLAAVFDDFFLSLNKVVRGAREIAEAGR